MTVEQVLALVQAGFSADEIRSMNGADAAPAPAPAPDPVPEPDEPAADPDPAPSPEATKAAPENPAAAPAWFTEYVHKNNEDMAALQRALQIRNVRRAGTDDPVPEKTPEQLMAEAYRAIVE